MSVVTVWVRRWQDMKLFSGNANVELAGQIAGLLGKELGNITVSRFADGKFLRLSASRMPAVSKAHAQVRWSKFCSLVVFVQAK